MKLSTPLSMDYIKYLNAPDSYGMTYDQWKDKHAQQDIEKCKQCGKDKNHFSICPKCHY